MVHGSLCSIQHACAYSAPLTEGSFAGLVEGHELPRLTCALMAVAAWRAECLSHSPAGGYAERMSKGKQRGSASARASAVDSAVKRASRSAVTARAVAKKGFKGGLKVPTGFVETLRERKNTKSARAGQASNITATFAGRRVTIYNEGPASFTIVTVGKDPKSGKKQRGRLTLTERVFRPMTRTHAAAISAAMHDPDQPTRKLPPRL